ncbi:MAG: glycosyltransferase family 2 protein [Candidatus Hydrogenedentes bacterium]|nr:glycosyltransferase family 2 protein [Candidatus Hydrogenedentota bacterium]
MSGKTDLTIVIVNYNSVNDLCNCLDSLFTVSRNGLKIEVYVVDNKSHDGSADMVERKFPQVHLIKKKENPGFAKSNNEVLRLDGARYFLVLNPDVIVPPGSLQQMVAYLDSHPDTGIVGCKLLNSDGSLQYSCRRFPDFLTIALRGIGADKLFPRAAMFRRYFMADWDHSEVAEVDWVFGSCIMARQDALHDIGLFDEGYFMYYEDVDLCYRMWNKWKVVYLPHIHMTHLYAHESHRISAIKLRLIHLKSAMRFFRKYGFFSTRPVLRQDADEPLHAGAACRSRALINESARHGMNCKSRPHR